MKTKIFNRSLLATSITLAIFSLNGCGGGKGDSSTTNHVQMSGAVVDDFVAYSRVYVDVNHNGKFDSSFEPYAYTDGTGYFSKGKDGTNYCANPNSPLYKFCLDVSDNLVKNAVIRVEAGRDLLTALTYQASMSLQTNGQTNDLKITSISSLEQVQKQLSQILNQSQLHLNGSINGKDIQAFLNSYLADTINLPKSIKAGNTQSIDANTLNPFSNTKVFKLAVNMHKMAETIAAFFAKNNLQFKTGNILNRPQGKVLKEKDIVPFVYMALLLNLNFQAGTNALSQIDSQTANNILEDTKQLLNLVTTNTPSINNTSVINTLARLYTFLESLQVNSTDLRTTLTQAELVTQSIKTKYEKQGTVSASDVDTVKNEANNINHYQTLDFETAITQASNGQTISAQGRTFEPILNKLLSNNYLYLDNSTNGGDKLQAFFKENSQKTDPQRNGEITICQQTLKNGPQQNHLFTGSWSWSAHKTYAILGQYLGISIIIKNLDPINNTHCQYQNGSCVAITYPNLDGKGLKTAYSSDPVNWNQNLNQADNLIRPLTGHSIPTDPSQCFTQ